MTKCKHQSITGRGCLHPSSPTGDCWVEVIESCLLSGDMKYINILPASQLLPPKTLVWDVTNKKSGELLGRIKYYAKWRQYCFFPSVSTVFSMGCLNEITGFIMAHKNDRREESVRR